MALVAWRLTTPRYADLSGEGARRAGGRWNPRGAAVVYAGDHPALAVAEYLVHVRDPEDLPDALVFLRIAVPDDVAVAVATRAELERADPDWRRAAAPACLTMGAAWLATGVAAVLRVPSAVVPLAENVLLNPAHPHAARWAIVETVPYTFEPRLLDPGRR
ncbi:MAG TPA: RES domain-containing protein [Gemmatirosa sp.]